MAKYNLVMTFKTAGDSKANVTVKDCLPLLEKTNVALIMDTIIKENIFETKTGDLVSKIGAKIVKSETDSYELS